ncbi:MAG: hypothetical protein KC618_00050, partial [Candidatus Omnitrophica bacterium]|nr:hypothetical protein [Candidatus Omnitrophota bacterium]
MKRTLAQIKEKAQTAIELAVFGAILIFVLGSIVQTTLGYNYQQNQTLRAMRLAMLQSFNYSAGLVPNPNGADGTASRNSASVLFIEDRLVAQSGKYAAVDRVPHVFSGGAVHTRNLFMPVEAGEDWNIPIFDVFINGKHFPFSTAALRSRNVAGTPLFTKTPRGVSAWDEGCADCFDLDRDGNIDVPIAQRATFLWQWTPVALNEISLENNRNLLVDLDGDLKEERIVGKNGTVLQYFDSQEGDVDFTINENEDKPPSGVTTDISVFTFTKEGQVLEIDEGKLFGPDRRYVRQARRREQMDVVQSICQL